MTKTNIVLFSDGTGNSSAKAQKTNVWRAFQALVQSEPNQVAKYDDGVGTSSNKYLATLGGAFGFGLKRNVIDLYKFVCTNYRPGDDVYGFGFSRGAFTIRVLVDLIASEGLVPFSSTQELDRRAQAAYRRYRVAYFPTRSPIVVAMRFLRFIFLALKDRIYGHPSYSAVRSHTVEAGRAAIRIRFLGLWDTVEAYGMPIESLKRGISLALWPMLSGDQRLAPIVQRACHALSLDDERSTFHPLLWDECAEALMVKEGCVDGGRITQVWFAGVHSNVGGGYPEDQLSLVPLEWMLGEAIANGLQFDIMGVKGIRASMSPFARMYDSRSGWASYYRYAPRQIYVRRDPTATGDAPPRYILPIIHGSVIMRMAYGSDRYSPISLPHEFWVLAPDGELLPMEGAPLSLHLDVTKSRRASVSNQAAGDAAITKDKSELQDAIKALSRPSRDLIRQVWDLVFWRQVVYSLTVFVTLLLAAFPLIGDAVSSVVAAVLGTSEDQVVARGIAENLQKPLSHLLPTYLNPWIGAIVDHPVEGGLLAALLAALVIGGRELQQRIHDTATTAWHAGKSLTHARGALQYPWGRTLSVNLFLLCAGAVVSWLGHAPVLAQYLTACAVLVLILLLFTLAGHRATRAEPADKPPTPRKPRDTTSLSLAKAIARRLRYSTGLRQLYHGATQIAVPTLFVLALVWIGLCLVNSISYSVYDAAGALCTGLPGSIVPTGSAVGHVSIDKLCQNTGYRVVLGQRYRVTVTAPNAWFDRETQTDVHGYPGGDPIHASAFLLKRHWGAPWFRPFIRIGEKGAEEYAIAPVVEGRAPPYPSCHALPRHDNGSHFDSIGQQQADSCNDRWPIPAERQSVSTAFTAHANGWVYFYANDAAWGWPGGFGSFYTNNLGLGTITLESIPVP